jgi:hypothetical protein
VYIYLHCDVYLNGVGRDNFTFNFVFSREFKVSARAEYVNKDHTSYGSSVKGFANIYQTKRVMDPINGFI